MLESFACPNCGTALDLDGTQTAMHCPGCGSSIIVPDNLRPSSTKPDPQIPDPSLSEVAALLRTDQRVHATILYREITGASLKDAQLAIDRFLEGGPLRRPNLLNG
jgi:DNA-directed RNA polymerase subunit RPC12/RpoP